MVGRCCLSKMLVATRTTLVWLLEIRFCSDVPMTRDLKIEQWVPRTCLPMIEGAFRHN